MGLGDAPRVPGLIITGEHTELDIVQGELVVRHRRAGRRARVSLRSGNGSGVRRKIGMDESAATGAAGTVDTNPRSCKVLLRTSRHLPLCRLILSPDTTTYHAVVGLSAPRVETSAARFRRARFFPANERARLGRGAGATVSAYRRRRMRLDAYPVDRSGPSCVRVSVRRVTRCSTPHPSLLQPGGKSRQEHDATAVSGCFRGVCWHSGAASTQPASLRKKSKIASSRCPHQKKRTEIRATEKKGLPPHDTWMVVGGRGRAPPRGGGQAMSAI